ncbi:DUF1801 domain-containing protein [Leptospira sp. 2 VSF19]|uniref:DUF1801 domain-containing protein n=1 Tax=Leptospira soteropolitanensis TaxID=2950025 RepID=A0AAW5VJA3_9LEPT|nr:DUF1801 domain-containing protein [Leptospira soteropolitanensis]MCW7494128.1 DUF1801 domain-containing protein [Leptospira soteropolitanensis]MCW7501606.1 DUF1801 domain-containing protein [Leptospira soteropolitanensis]MCW7523974.1 DUF1801 domain-containing protein [Leptospira soteropolitanensis]MCW7527839.1 DUF1801 domain-containing protein [Leptospira soteropolitanensis]MCW7531576.1 DUF1801 domain-containing protein [Leptospira soteropolitanensis]
MKDKFEQFYSSLTETEISIILRLKEILKPFDSLEERISYSVLYYFQNSRVCFIWPASIKPGPKSGVQFGFCNGYLLNDPNQKLERENRKQVYCITYHSKEEINELDLITFIKNALEVDQKIFKKKKQRVPNGTSY